MTPGRQQKKSQKEEERANKIRVSLSEPWCGFSLSPFVHVCLSFPSNAPHLKLFPWLVQMVPPSSWQHSSVRGKTQNNAGSSFLFVANAFSSSFSPPQPSFKESKLVFFTFSYFLH